MTKEYRAILKKIDNFNLGEEYNKLLKRFNELKGKVDEYQKVLRYIQVRGTESSKELYSRFRRFEEIR